MCTEQQHHEILALLAEITTLCTHRPPIDKTFQISSSQPYIVDYQERKHIYIWLPSVSLTLSFDDYGTGMVQAQVWTNIAMPPGVRIFAPNNATTTPIMVRCTDEMVP